VELASGSELPEFPVVLDGVLVVDCGELLLDPMLLLFDELLASGVVVAEEPVAELPLPLVPDVVLFCPVLLVPLLVPVCPGVPGLVELLGEAV
jgi:hypothetical protein